MEQHLWERRSRFSGEKGVKEAWHKVASEKVDEETKLSVRYIRWTNIELVYAYALYFWGGKADASEQLSIKWDDPNPAFQSAPLGQVPMYGIHPAEAGKIVTIRPCIMNLKA